MEMNFKELEKSILNNLETEISISNYQKELSMEKNNKKHTLSKVAMFILTIFLITGGTVLAFKAFRKIDNREKIFGLGTLKNAEEQGYIENVEMDYYYSENIGVKVNNVILSDNDFSLILDFDFSQKKLTNNSLLINYIIYDENNNVYSYGDYNLYSRGDNYKIFCKDMNLKYDKNNWKNNIIAKNQAQNNLLETEEQLISQIALNTDRELPNSKKLYIRVFDIGYLENNEFISLYNGKGWILSIDIPEKFYTRTNLELISKENTKNFVLNTAYVTDTSMTLIANIKGIDGFLNDKIFLTDENQNKYESNLIYKNSDLYTLKFNITKNQISNKLFINILNGEEIKKIELQIK